jgi:hypothetical protein
MDHVGLSLSDDTIVRWVKARTWAAITGALVIGIDERRNPRAYLWHHHRRPGTSHFMDVCSSIDVLNRSNSSVS